jgi:hypothetical protein
MGKKRGWLQKTHRTGYFGEEKWEGGGPPYIYRYFLVSERVRRLL